MLFAISLALWCHNHNQRAINGEMNDQNMANPMNIWELHPDNEEANASAVNGVDEMWQPLFEPPPALDQDTNAPEE